MQTTQQFLDAYKELIATVAGVCLLTLVVSLREYAIEKALVLWDRLFNIKHRDVSIATRQVEGDQQVQDLLVEMRGFLKADRTRVWQFHNGVVFSNNSPMWRMSCTHESCKKGISHELPSSQNVLSSTITELLTPVFTLGTAPTWCREVGKDTETTIHWFSIPTMPDGFCKSWLMSQGVKYMLASPLTYKKGIIGIASACYCFDAAVPNKEDIMEFHDSVATINYVLKKETR